MPLKPCLDCGLPVPASRCPACAEKLWARIGHRPNASKPSASARGYGAQWQRLRRIVLERDQWTCYLCGKELIGSDATVDHLVPLSKDRTQRLTPDTLRACCRSCNSRKKNN